MFLCFLNLAVELNEKPIKNRYGVVQGGGGVLGPKLFNEFLQDLGKYLNTVLR